MRGLIACIALAGLTLLGGCRVCESGDDCAYPTYGGSWERTNRNHGRVGSIFAPAGAKVVGDSMPLTSIAPSRSIHSNSLDESSDNQPDDLPESMLDDLEESNILMPEREPLAPLGEIDQT